MDREELRLQILLILFAIPSYEANEGVLLAGLKKRGLAINRDVLKIELSWLDNVANALVDSDFQGLHIALLSGDGLEHCEGTRVIPGIRRPRPDEKVG